MPIRIPVSAAFNSDDLKREIEGVRAALNNLGAAAAKANGAKFRPVDDLDIERVRRLRREFESLMRVSPGLRKRVAASGQQGVPFESLDWERAIPDTGQRTKYARQVTSYLMPGWIGHAPTPPVHQPVHGVGAAAGAVAQAGLRGVSGATGGVGGVAANAVGGGMSMGFGAGLMGLLGGLGALGIGKLAGAAVENLSKAEGNSVALDRLKRTLGDVTVSFGALKAAVDGSAEAGRIRYDEAGRLSMSFVKAGNLSGDRLGELVGGVTTGVGLSRSFGLEPEEGVGVLGRMRALSVTRNEQDTRRFALLIGETIGKSNAFSKADEVMEAIADYATMQTRSGMGAANVDGYAGMFSSLTASGIPGLDPAGAGSLLSRINSALTAGGAKGEASQFFTARVANRLGLNPLEAQVLREGGAFASNDEAFGEGSVYHRYIGRLGPKGNTTHLEARLAELRGAYGSDPMMLAQAAGNDLGVSMRQAMAMLSVKPGQMGEMGKYADLTKLSDTGIGNLSKALYGSGADRRGLADSLLQRSGAGALTTDERGRLIEAMQADEKTQKQVLAELVASRGQEETQGSIIRDQKNLLDNIKTDIASKLIPLTEQMRAGIIYMAGGNGKMTTEQIMQSVIEADSNGRARAIKGRFDPEIERLEGQSAEHASAIRSGKFISTFTSGTAAEKAQASIREHERAMKDTDEKIAALQKEKAVLLEQENKRRKQEIESMRSSVATERSTAKVAASAGASAGAGAGADALFDAVLAQESGGHHTVGGRLITSSAGARGISQVMPATGRNPGFGIKPLQGESEAEYRRFGRDYLDAMTKRYGGDRAKALAAYNAGPGAVDAAVSKHGDNWLSVLPKETQNYVPSVLGRVGATPMPEDAAAAWRQAESRQQVDVTISPVEIIHRDPQGREIAPRQPLETRFGPSRPFGAPS